MENKEFGIDTLVGRKILKAQVNPTRDKVFLETDKGNLWLSWYGDCCAYCYLAHVEGSDLLVGHTIIEIYNSEWTDIDIGSYAECTQSMGTTFKTDKGYFHFESRVEHNGYYGGYIKISHTKPLGQYDEELQIQKDMEPLTDF